MSDLIISVSGLRGIVGDSLDQEVASRYAAAFLSTLADGPIVLSRDGRPSGPELADSISRTIVESGRDCLDAGVAATPTCGQLVLQHSAAGGIQISASHNPAEYNGLKLFGGDGRVLPADRGNVVLEAYREPTTLPRSASPGMQHPLIDATSGHWKRIAAVVDVARIRERRWPVLLDATHGAGSLLGMRVLEELNCDVTLIGGTPDGLYEHPPEPTAENLAGVAGQITETSAVIGFCQDPDADRLAIIDEHGRYVGEEYTLALCVEHELTRRVGPIVTNCSTSRMSQDLARRYGAEYFASAVGEANVVDAMLAHDAVLGGEGNGGVIDPQVGLVRDSFVAIARVLDAMTARDAPVSQLVDSLPRYEIVKTKIPLERPRLDACLSMLERRFPDSRSSRPDGLRLDWDDRWLLVRASNTEPIVRAIAEAPHREQAQELCDAAAEVFA